MNLKLLTQAARKLRIIILNLSLVMTVMVIAAAFWMHPAPDQNWKDFLVALIRRMVTP